jgi:hypothetical protein
MRCSSDMLRFLVVAARGCGGRLTASPWASCRTPTARRMTARRITALIPPELTTLTAGIDTPAQLMRTCGFGGQAFSL